MDGWIPFEEGNYRVERAVLIGAGHGCVEVEEAIIEVSGQGGGRRQLRGRGRVRNELLVKLLDEGDELDLLLDLGAEFKYLMRSPILQGGKIFAPGVKSFIQFLPAGPWEPLAEAAFAALTSRLRSLNDPQD